MKRLSIKSTESVVGTEFVIKDPTLPSRQNTVRQNTEDTRARLAKRHLQHMTRPRVHDAIKGGTYKTGELVSNQHACAIRSCMWLDCYATRHDCIFDCT